MEKGLRAIELARLASDPSSELSARFWVGSAQLGTGDSMEAAANATAMLSSTERFQDRYWLATALWFNERVSIYNGDWLAAKQFNDRGLSASPSDQRLLATRMLSENEDGTDIEEHIFLDRFHNQKAC